MEQIVAVHYPNLRSDILSSALTPSLPCVTSLV